MIIQILSILISFVFLTGPALASIYKMANYKYTNTGRFNIELGNLPKIKNQKKAGLCYGFTAVTMLEHHKCKVLNLDCTSLGLHEQFSALDVTAGMNKGKIKEGGVSNRIFENISRKLKVASEKCAPYSQLELDMSFIYSDDKKQSWQKNITRGLDVLENFYVKNMKYSQMEGASEFKKKCFDQFLKQMLPLEASSSQVISSLNRAVLSEFLYEILIPKKCTGKNYLKVPEFQTTSFPLIGESVNYEIIMQKMESVLSSGHLINLNFCPSFKFIKKYGREVCQGHAVVISGMKEICTKDKECKTLIKIQNSYGDSWQKYNNDGWVLAKPLLDSALRRNNESRRDNILSWITPPGVTIKSTRKREFKENNYKHKRRRTVNPLLLQRRSDRRRGSRRGTPVFKCAGESGFSYRDKGHHCRIVRYVR